MLHTQSSSRSFPGAPLAAVGVTGLLWLSWGAGCWLWAPLRLPRTKPCRPERGAVGGSCVPWVLRGPVPRAALGPLVRGGGRSPSRGLGSHLLLPRGRRRRGHRSRGAVAVPCRAVPASPCLRAARSLLPSPSPGASRPLSQRRFPSPRGAGRSPAPAWSCSSRRYKGLRRRHLPLALRRAALPLPLPAQGSGPPGARPPGPVPLSRRRVPQQGRRRGWTIPMMRTWTSCVRSAGTRSRGTTTGCSPARAAR